LSPENSSLSGRWNTDNAPYQREIMDAVCDPRTEEIVFLKSAQVGATEILNNIVAFHMAHQRCSMLVVQPTIEMARDWSRNRFSNMVRDTPALSGLVSTAQRDADNTALMKRGHGFFVAICGANSSAGLSSRAIRLLCADEVSRFPPSAGDEGSPLALAIARTKTFYDRKIYICSTPTFKGCEIEERYKEGDQRRYFVPCPDCDHMQELTWAGVHWDEGDPTSAQYACVDCGVLIPHSRKAWMLARGEWRATQPFKGTASFFINELYSPWRTWDQMASAFVVAKKDPFTLQTFVNTSLGESFSPSVGEEIEWTEFLQRREHFDLESVPAEVQVLTCGIDCQKDRLEITICGWAGEHLTCWIIEHLIMWGDPSTDTVWAELSDFLEQTFTTQDGRELPIAGTCIDSGGHWTQSIYAFTKPRTSRRVWAIKGQSVPGKPIANRPSIVGRQRVPLYPVGTDTCKEWIFSRLTNTEPPAVFHFSHTLDEVYFEQLASSERRVERFERGVKRMRWELVDNKRNEGLDCMVYNLACIYILNPKWSKFGGNHEGPLEPAPLKPADTASIARRRSPNRPRRWMDIR
tara:strand:+ start:528 stop:2261 length:1734 start_codon:yes stop_codon:yes gene_type:complete